MTNSPDPGTPQTGTKGIVAAALGVAAVFVSAWVADVEPFTAKEAATAALSALATGGLLGGITYKVKNRRLP